jgi:hypothetical protein
MRTGQGVLLDARDVDLSLNLGRMSILFGFILVSRPT